MIKGSGWRDRKSVLVVEVGFEDKRRYPETSKGGFNWAKATDFVLETSKALQQRTKNAADKQRKFKAAQAAAERINLAKGCATEEKVDWGSGRYVSTKRAYMKATEWGTFTVVMPELTQEQAERFLDLAIALGLND